MTTTETSGPGLPTIADYPLPAAADLPPNRVGWRIDAARAVVLVHDLQRYFVRPFPAGLRTRLITHCATVVSRARALDVPIAYTAQPGRMTVEERGLLADFWGPGMASEPADRQVVEEVAPAPGDWQLTKWRYSAFVRSDLEERLRRVGRDQLVICGVYAHLGVLMTAVDAYSRDIQPFVVADAIADFTDRHHRLAVDYTAERCGVVTVADQVLP